MSNNIVKIYEWTSSAGGAATVELEKGYAGKKVNWVKTIPGAGVSAYTLTLVDGDDADWLCGEGATRSTSVAEVIFAESEIVLPNDTLTLTISGAGDTKTGTVKMSIEG